MEAEATQGLGQIRVFGTLSGLAATAVWLALPRPVRLTPLALGVVIAGVVIWVGLAAGRPFGKGAPLLAGRDQTDESRRDLVRGLGRAAILGGLLGALVLGALLFLLVPLEPSLATRLSARAGLPIWTRFAIAVEASILEELFFRLLLVSGAVWVIGRGWRKAPPPPAKAVVWMGILISAMAFAAAHLPNWLAATTPTTILIGSVIALNGLAGIVFGQVYWRWGIEAAILAHFAGDLVTQVLGSRLVSLAGG